MNISYGKQDIQETDVESVIAVLKSDFLTQGPMVPRFEDELKRNCKANYAVAVNSATSALHIALLSLKVGPGDIVWTSPNTFVASSNAALYCGASVDFVDIDPHTYNICPQKLEQKLLQAVHVGNLPKVVIPVHFAGQSCDMRLIAELSKKYGFKVVEDASHAIGGRYLGHPIGNCEYSDITIFSFHPVKIVTTGEGGAALTNDKTIANRMALLRGHGVTRDSLQMRKDMDGPWYYEQTCLGFNYRMSDLHAALGISQLARLGDYLKLRHEIADRYRAGLQGLPLSLPHQSEGSYSSFHLFVVRLKLDEIKPLDQRSFFEAMHSRGIMVALHYIPVHTQPFYQDLGFQYGDFPAAESYYNEAVSLPIHARLSQVDQQRVIDALREILSE